MADLTTVQTKTAHSDKPVKLSVQLAKTLPQLDHLQRTVKPRVSLLDAKLSATIRDLELAKQLTSEFLTNHRVQPTEPIPVTIDMFNPLLLSPFEEGYPVQGKTVEAVLQRTYVIEMRLEALSSLLTQFRDAANESMQGVSNLSTILSQAQKMHDDRKLTIGVWAGSALVAVFSTSLFPLIPAVGAVLSSYLYERSTSRKSATAFVESLGLKDMETLCNEIERDTNELLAYFEQNASELVEACTQGLDNFNDFLTRHFSPVQVLDSKPPSSTSSN